MFSMTKLREQSHILLWTLLFFFIASMAVGGLVGGANIMNLILGDSKNLQLNVGSIDGNNITRNRYLREREIQLNRFRRQGQTIDNRAYQNAGDFAWNTIIERYILDDKIKTLGLEVSLDEIYDFLLNTPPQAFKDNLMDAGYFGDEERKFDTESYIEAVKNGALPVDLEPLLMNWENYLRTWLADRKLRTLFNQMATVTDNAIRTKYIKDSLNCTLDYIYIPITSISDSLINVTDSEILKRYQEDKEELYSLKERITAEYILFEIPKPISSEDSLNVVVIEDSIMQLARDFSTEADYTSFTKALTQFNLTKVDTIEIHESFESNSGIPFQMGVLRPAVRFAFDNSIGSVSEPFTATNGVAVFHTLNKIDADYKSINEVEESLRRTIRRENKNNYAKNILNGIQNSDEWAKNATNNFLVEYKSNETQKIGGSFPGIGKNNALTGTILAMENGNTSEVLETYNAVLIIKLVTKDAINDSLYNEAYDGIRNNLLNSERGQSYSYWLNNAKKTIEITDYRSEVY